MAIPERDPAYTSDGTNRTTIYSRESSSTAWFVGIIVVLALLAIGYLIFSANSGPSTTSVDVTTPPATTSPMTDNPATTPAPVTNNVTNNAAPAPDTSAAPMSATPAPAETTPAPAETTPAPADNGGAAAPATPAPAAPAQ